MGIREGVGVPEIFLSFGDFAEEENCVKHMEVLCFTSYIDPGPKLASINHFMCFI